MSMKRHQRTVGKSDTHLTPPEIMAKLGSFALDPACPNYVVRPLASQCLTKQEDGLKTTWRGRVWLNPPFNRYERPKWMAKMAAHGDGIMLVPAATETKAFYDYVWAKADAICFVRGRPHFHTAADKRQRANCGCSIVLVGYGPDNALYLRNCGLGVVAMCNAAGEWAFAPSRISFA